MLIITNLLQLDDDDVAAAAADYDKNDKKDKQLWPPIKYSSNRTEDDVFFDKSPTHHFM